MAGRLADVTRGGLPRRLIQLYIGLLIYGLGGALQVRSGLGLDPWDVFHQGLSNHVGLAIGTVLILVGAAVLLLWIPLRQMPGLGTISNVVLIGVSMNACLQWLPHVHALGWRIACMVAGVLIGCIATGLYIGAHFGPGPRDGLMTGLARRTGRSIRLTRTCLEVSVLTVGWLLGGTVGVGTVLYAVAIGPLAQFFMRVLDTRPVVQVAEGDAVVAAEAC
ncbi:MAG: YczE/YyaS/YitT family protein [Mycobacterium sp.]